MEQFMEYDIRLITQERSIVLGENIYDFTAEGHYDFCFGKSYALLGDFGKGGYLVSGLLSDKVPIMKERIIVNGNDDSLFAKKYGWMIGQSYYSNLRSKEMTVSKILNRFKNNKNYSEIIEYFEIEENRLPNLISQMPHEKWRVSSAIGLLAGKRLFCFPYMNSRLLYDVIYSSGNLLTVKKITNMGGIVIIPTNDVSLISCVVDKTVCINNSRFDDLCSLAEAQSKRLNDELIRLHDRGLL